VFVVWGTKHKTRNAGIVGDQCEACGELAAFVVTDHYEAGHVYYISLTQGTYRGSSRTCERCGAEFRCHHDEYERLIPLPEAVDLSVQDLLEYTNPELLRAAERREELERQLTQGGRAAIEARRAIAIEELQALGAIPHSEELAARLLRWDELDESGRARLLDEADHAVAQARTWRQSVAVFVDASRSYRHSSDFKAALFGIFVFAAGIVSIPALITVPGVIGLAIVALLLAWWVHGILVRAALRRWVTRTLLPRTREAELPLDPMLEFLESVDYGDESLEPGLRELARRRSTLGEMLLDEGQLQPRQKAPDEEQGIFDS
jgi:hypothetical protein